MLLVDDGHSHKQCLLMQIL